MFNQPYQESKRLDAASARRLAVKNFHATMPLVSNRGMAFIDIEIFEARKNVAFYFFMHNGTYALRSSEQ